jgi:LuxR family maltose regulon positive regulatory protein
VAAVKEKAPAARLDSDHLVRSARPLFGPGLVSRPRLLSRLRQGGASHIALLSAPAGYGKTTLLAELAESDSRAVGWLTLDERDNDPALFVASLVHLLDEIEPVEERVLDALSVPRPNIADAVLPRLGRALELRSEPFLLVLDDVHCLNDHGSLAALALVCTLLPDGTQVALGSRSEPGLPLGRLRAHRRLTELTARDLAMTPAESRELLKKIGVSLSPAQLRAVIDRTERWPAAQYLAGLSFGEQSDLTQAVSRFTGDDRLVADYLRDEFLSQVSSSRLRFLTRTAILDRLSGPLCDSVLEMSGSAGLLRDLSRSNLLLTPLDRNDDVYRYHALFAEMLLSELRRVEPAVEPALHKRASAWYAAHGDADRAIDHAIDAGEIARAGDLIWSKFPEYQTRGRRASIRRWLDRFSEEEIASYPYLALSAGYSEIGDGRSDEAARWFARAARFLDESDSNEGKRPLEAALAIAEATAGRGGIARMGERAAFGSGVEPADSPWQSICGLLEGVAAHLTGDPERARERLEAGARRGAGAAPSIQVLCLAQLSLLAFDREDRQTAGILASQARAQVERSALSDYPTMTLAVAVGGLIATYEGRTEDAAADIKHARELLRTGPDLPLWMQAESRITLAQAALRLGDLPEARELLAEAGELVALEPDAVLLADWLRRTDAALNASVAVAGSDGLGLTPAELRLLPYLPTHLSFRQIAEQLFVSPNTVKTQAQAIYRKLECSSRTEAVDVARRAGLLSD